MDDDDPQSIHDYDRFIYAGLLGLGMASILQLFERDEPDLPQLVGVYCQSVAIPLLTTGLIAAYARKIGKDVSGWYNAVGAVGVLAAVCGFGSMIFHYGNGPGIIFAVGSFMGTLMIRKI